jgi:pentapeptide MXKDX repeat protein
MEEGWMDEEMIDDMKTESDYMEGDYMEGDYMEGNYMEGDYMEGNYMEGDYMEGDCMEGDCMEGDAMVDELPGETTEASRTMTYMRRAQRDRVAAPSQLRKESVEKELNLLREKNEEYKKALDFFRNKLNEVAVFNSNLAYSTRLFTEHSTTKQEKINILRRFDNVETIKESKSLYKAIKSELDGVSKSNEVVTESVQRKLVSTPSNGSASNLIESKTYENPQFLRMKDLMGKIK